MTVSVRYYAMMKDLTGLTHERIELPDRSNAAALIQQIVDRHPATAGLASYLRLATPQHYIAKDGILPSAGEISVIPPVSGG